MLHQVREWEKGGGPKRIAKSSTHHLFLAPNLGSQSPSGLSVALTQQVE